MTHFKTYLYVAFLAILSSSPCFAQCWNGNCQTSIRTRQSVRIVERRSFDAGVNGALTRVPATTRFIPFVGGACETSTPAPCASVETCEEPPKPCEPAVATCEVTAIPTPCAPCETFAPGSITCEPTATPEPCEPVATCEPTAQFQSYRPTASNDCPTGSCPLRTASRAAVRLATAPLRGFLDVANRTRTRYGVVQLQYDARLEAEALAQAQHCARVGFLQHGAGAPEILAQNSQGIETAVNQWLASPSHRQILLNGGYRYAGVAVVRDSAGRSWCAMRFR